LCPKCAGPWSCNVVIQVAGEVNAFEIAHIIECKQSVHIISILIGISDQIQPKKTPCDPLKIAKKKIGPIWKELYL